MEAELRAELEKERLRSESLVQELESERRRSSRIMENVQDAHREQVKRLNHKIIDLERDLKRSPNSSISHSDDQIRTNEISHSRDEDPESIFTGAEGKSTGDQCPLCKHLKAHVAILNRQVHLKEGKVTELETQNRELASELENAKLDCGLWQHEVEVLKSSIGSTPSEEPENAGELANLLEIVEKQARKLAAVSEQRNKLMETVRVLERRLNEIGNREEESQKSDSESSTDDRLERLFEAVVAAVPDVVQEFAMEIHDQPIESRILEVVKLLVDAHERYMARPSIVKKVVSNDDQILGHLQNAMMFIRTLAGSTKDSNVRKAIFRQCEVIRTFIDEKEISPAKVPSLFVSDDCEDVIEAVSRLVGDKKLLEKSPIKELVTLMSGVIGVNALLANRVRQIHTQLEKRKQDMDIEIAAKEKALAERDAESEIVMKVRERLCPLLDPPDSDVCKAVDFAAVSIEVMTDACKGYRQTIADQESQMEAMRKADRTAELAKRCYKMGQLIVGLKRELEKEKAKTNTTLNELSIQIDEAEQKVAENEVSKEKLEEMKDKCRQLRKYKGKAQILENGMASLEQKKEELEVALENLLHENERLAAENESLQAKIVSAAMKSDEDHQKKATLKKRVQELEQEKRESIDLLRKSQEKLQHTRQETYEKLEKQLREARAACVNYQERITELEGNKRAHRQMIIKSKIAEGTLAASLQDAMVSMQNANALIKSQKQSFEAKMDDLKKEFIAYINKHRRSLLTALGVDPNEFLTMSETITLASELYDPVLIGDAKQARKVLGLEDDQTILDGITILTRAISERDKQIDSQKHELEALTQRSRTLKTALDDFKAKNRQMQKWPEWANTLYMLAMNDRIIPADEDDLRTELEDFITTRGGSTRSNRKLQILRAEKAAMKLYGDQVTGHKKPHHFICTSIRPAIIAALFAKRIADLVRGTV